MKKIAHEIIAFLESHEQVVEVNPTDYSDEGLTYLVIRNKRIIIIIRYISVIYNNKAKTNHIGFKTIQLWEDTWRKSQNIVESRLLSAIGKSTRLPARVMEIKRIDKPFSDNFLKKHHLQGAVKAKFKYGLFLPKRYYRLIKNVELIEHQAKEMLVAVATFSSAKTYYRGKQEFRSTELIRFANHSNFTIVGGLNKLLKHFEKEQNPDDIMTYADADWSDGSTYEKIGFQRVEKLPEIAFYINKTTFDRQRFLPKENTENFVKIYNSGSYKLINYLKDLPK